VRGLAEGGSGGARTCHVVVAAAVAAAAASRPEACSLLSLSEKR